MQRVTRLELGLDARKYHLVRTFCQCPENYRTVKAMAQKIDDVGISKWLIYSVTHGVGYDKLFRAGYGTIPFSRTVFYNYKKIFFALMAEEIN